MLNFIRGSSMEEADLRRLSDDDLVREREWLLTHVPETTHLELLTYKQAAEALGVKYERVAGLVSQGILIAEKRPRDAKKYLGSDQIGWYQLKQQGKGEGHHNPKLVREEGERRATQVGQAQSRDTLTELRRYVAEHMASTDAASQLNAALTEIAQHLAGTLVRETLGLEPLPAEERERRAALLAALTQKGGDTR